MQMLGGEGALRKNSNVFSVLCAQRSGGGGGGGGGGGAASKA